MSVAAMSSAPSYAGRTGLTPVSSVPSPTNDFQSRAAGAGVLPEGVLRQGDLTVDVDAYEARLGGEVLALSPRQLELLAVFLAAPGKVWSREQLHWICWGDTTPSRRVDVQLCRIRGKVGHELFRNVRDRGWTLLQR